LSYKDKPLPDENLREKIASETVGVRNVIVALAFGALARERDSSG
jgi:hypothetical protein